MSTPKTTTKKTTKTAAKKTVKPAPETKTEEVAVPEADAAVVNVPAVEAVAQQETAEAAPAPEITVVPKKKILFVASEAAPFIATGGLAEVIGSLSKAPARS